MKWRIPKTNKFLPKNNSWKELKISSFYLPPILKSFSIQTRHIRLDDFPNGKMLKINRRNNSLHYRVYQKDEDVRFELEFKHRQTKLVRDYLFHNQFDIFEHQLVFQYLKYSERVLRLDYIYTDWIVDFQRRHHQLVNSNSRLLVTNYLKTEMGNHEEEERLFHLLQFLSFTKSLELNPFKDCEKYRIKKQIYYGLKFSLREFVEFTGIQISKQSQRDKLIRYFEHLQKLDPIVKKFSDRGFRSYVCFPYVECENSSGNSWSTIAIFRKNENGKYSQFTTTCTLTRMERNYFLNSGGNFVTQNNLDNPEILPILKNLTNKENEK
jgi:hypothetical protein